MLLHNGSLILLDTESGEVRGSVDSAGGAKAAPMVDPWNGCMWLAQYLGPGAGSDLVICAPPGEPPNFASNAGGPLEISNGQKHNRRVLSIRNSPAEDLALSCKARPGSLILSGIGSILAPPAFWICIACMPVSIV